MNKSKYVTLSKEFPKGKTLSEQFIQIPFWTKNINVYYGNYELSLKIFLLHESKGNTSHGLINDPENNEKIITVKPIVYLTDIILVADAMYFSIEEEKNLQLGEEILVYYEFL